MSTVVRFSDTDYTLVHSKAMLLENRTMLEIQRDQTKDEKHKAKLQSWIDKVNELLYPKKAA